MVDTANAPAVAAPAVPATAPGAPAAAPAAAPSRLTSSDQARLNRVGSNIRSLAQRVEAAGLPVLLNEPEVTNFRNSIANSRTELAGFPGDAAGVAEEVRNLDAVAAKLEARLSDAKAKGAALGDVEAELGAIEARIRGLEVPPPQAYKPEEGPAAAGQLVKTLLEIKARSVADVATVERFAQAGFKDQRIDRLRHWAGAERQRRADETLRAMQQASEAEVQRGLQHVAFHAATDPAEADHRANRLLGEGRRQAALDEFQRGSAAVETATAIDAALSRQGGPDRAAQAKAMTDGRTGYEAKYRVALAGARMPAAGMTDAKYLAIAREVLANPAYGKIAPAKRLVINSKQVARHEKKEAEIRPGTVSTTAAIYHWVWDEFQVATAEPAGDEHYVFYNTLKFFHQGAPTTPTGRWVLAGRFQGERILAENIDK
ncbi:MAG: hypothetical protein EXQ87_12530 [Alphaproteobacteria bacterium]|nr:hypothetical protein [Alphaproteobacteria bacterium]